VYSAFYNGWVCHHGVPVHLHSDQGANLVKSVVAPVADLLNIYQTRTFAFHPMGNGAAEKAVGNSNKVISAIIAREENSDPMEWDISCPKATLAINTSPSTSTQQTP
jgi:rRNA pseudouridine-1189 N-methylase Emg1 (Nep1/Mra1 family)